MGASWEPRPVPEGAWYGASSLNTHTNPPFPHSSMELPEDEPRLCLVCNLVDQPHREPGMEPQRLHLGAFLEPRPVPKGAWHGAS